MNVLLLFNILTGLVAIAVLTRLIPGRLYAGFLRGMHNTIGISTPNDSQVRWVCLVWIVSTLVIVDAMAAVLYSV